MKARDEIETVSLMGNIVVRVEAPGADLSGDDVIVKHDATALQMLVVRLKQEISNKRKKDGAVWVSSLWAANICFNDITKCNKRLVLLTILKLLRVVCSRRPRIKLKYNINSFLEVYDVFENYDQDDLKRLWHSANWMDVLFQIIKPKHNKGLALDVVSKFIGIAHGRYMR